MQRRLHSRTKVWCTSCSNDLVQPACGVRPAMQVQMEMSSDIATWSQCSGSAGWLTCSTMHDVQNKAKKLWVGKGIQRRPPARHGWRTWAFSWTGGEQIIPRVHPSPELLPLLAEKGKHLSLCTVCRCALEPQLVFWNNIYQSSTVCWWFRPWFIPVPPRHALFPCPPKYGPPSTSTVYCSSYYVVLVVVRRYTSLLVNLVKVPTCRHYRDRRGRDGRASHHWGDYRTLF